ncbi:dsDNA-binding SOS-regulon protein [Duganella sp. SG902]|uniref:DUF1640 domain-containing protein n=1 Tax=Duganella sp. SG902 TaxID=2587016 RepID=UPI00159D02C0|nr:DUF1640 domain-containing protein [Duganella sp. SG902]NVM78471.1 dsDNA-binding SOS-regulon protein [Duganella sp. SG902]
MHGTNENPRVEDSGKSSYDVRIAALETDVAVIRNSFATKDDITALRAEMHASHERLFALIYEFKLEVQTNSAKQREEFQTEHATLRFDFKVALDKQREELNTALAKQREELNAALAKQREEFNAALAKQREDFHIALQETRMDLHRALMGHVWRLYGFASLLLGCVYYIARYVH